LVFGSIRITELPAMTQINPSPTAILEGLLKWIVAAIVVIPSASGTGGCSSWLQVEGRGLGAGGCAVGVGAVTTDAERHAVNPAIMRALTNSRNNLAEGFMAASLFQVS
jgi:hypothetical protein